MKWNNRGHELDDYAQSIIEKFTIQKKIFVFGAGILGKILKNRLDDWNCFGGYFDNSYEKQQSGVNGTKVGSLNDFLTQTQRGILVIAADKKNIPIISQQMINAGLKRGLDFFDFDEFIKRVFPIIVTYCFDKSYVELSQISLTERCTLKCEKCAHGCPYNNNETVDLSLDDAFKTADIYFKVVDVTNEFVLIGGEPLLYKDLCKLVEYIGSRYREKIITFSIATNGTLIPSEELLKLCKKYNVIFRISNYSKAIPRIRDRYKMLGDLLREHEITFFMGEEEIEWFDYGFDYVNNSNYSEEQIMEVFDCCKTNCREIRNNKYYYCVMARSVSDNMNFGVGEDDYLDFEELLKEKEYRKILLEFNLGYSEKGYLDMCRRCNGSLSKSKHIPAAVQMK